MSAGLFALLDDVAALARLAAASLDDVGVAAGKASLKTAALGVDDAAVTPQYVHGIAAERELPIIRKIAIGSLRNKLVLILPVAMLLSQFVPIVLPILLILGGSYLAYEGAHKVWEWLAHRGQKPAPAEDRATVDHTPQEESHLVSGAVRTDFILSAEIMVLALDSVSDESFWTRLAIMLVVAVLMTVAVYGVVALIVKMDDVGLLLSQRSSAAAQRTGHLLVAAMPKLMTGLTTLGVAAMLWVGGHILLVNVGELGWEAPYDLVHHLEVAVEEAMAGIAWLSGFVVWLVDTLASAATGLLVGGMLLALLHLLPIGQKHGAAQH